MKYINEANETKSYTAITSSLKYQNC